MSKASDFLSAFDEEDVTDTDRGFAKYLGVKLPDDGWDLENAHKNPFKSKDGIENPSDGGGQGNDPKQSSNPYYQTIINNGYIYSHSTPVAHGDYRTNHHTYKNAKGQCVSVWQSKNGWRWEFSKSSSSGRSIIGNDDNELQKKLSGKDPEKQARIRELRRAKAQFAQNLNDDGIAHLEDESLEPWQAKMVSAYFLGDAPDAQRLPRDYRWLGNITTAKGHTGKVMLHNDPFKGYTIKIR